MPVAVDENARQIRILQRHPLRCTVRFSLPAKRPSLLDPRLRGDPWILPRADGNLSLCFDCWEMAAVGGSALDVPSLNGLLHRVRHRTPRRRS